jgi:hypothetical protein
LGQPEGHVHVTVQLDSRGQLGASLLPLSYLDVQRAETEVAVRLEWTHAEILGQGEGLAVVGFGLFNLWRLASRRNVVEEAQGIRLVAAFLMCAGERQHPLGEGVRLFQAASQQIRLPQGETTERLEVYASCRSTLLQRLREQWHGVGNAPGQGVYASPNDPAIQGK